MKQVRRKSDEEMHRLTCAVGHVGYTADAAHHAAAADTLRDGRCWCGFPYATARCPKGCKQGK